MRIKLSYFTPLLAAGAVAAAIAAAPTAMAASLPSGCYMMGPDPVCPDTHSTLISSPPGNSQINASPPVTFGPQYPYWEGGYGPGAYGGFGHGGGGGFGHGGGGGHGK
jgi:hypothetical protein